MVMTTHRQMKGLKAIGVKDSKQLSVAGREELEAPIAGHIVAHGFTVIGAEVVGDHRQNINQLELQAMAAWIRQINPKAVYVDVPAPGGKGVENFCQTLAWWGGIARSRILGANKGDQRFPIVSAASIMAKLHRDRLIETIKTECGDFGSGYPSDPKTVAYLKEVLSIPGQVLPAWVRAKWGTLRHLAGPRLEQSPLF